MGNQDQRELVIRRVAPTSVFKFSLLLFASLYAVWVVAAVTLWIVSSTTGLRGNIESLIGDLFYAGEFRLHGGQLLRTTIVGGAVVVGIGAGLNFLLAVFYNLISDVVGGVRVVAGEYGQEPSTPVGPTEPLGPDNVEAEGD